MRDDPSVPWWLGGGSDDAPSREREASRPTPGPYPDRDAPEPPPPPPSYGPDSEWLRDASGAVPQVPRHLPPSVGSYGDYASGAFPQSHQAPAPPLQRRRSASAPPRAPHGPMSPIAPPPPPSAGGNPILRPLLAVCLVVLLVTAGIALWRSNVIGSAAGAFTFPGFGAAPATATPTGYAQSAKISFTRLTQTIAAPSSTLVAATDTSGQIKATKQTASVTGATASAIPATYQRASSITVSLTVTNNSSGDTTSGGGLSISSSDGKVSCSLQDNIDVPAKGKASQYCIEPLKPETAAHWDFTDPATGLVYTGDSPAGGNAAYYYVPTNCGDGSAAIAAARAALQAQLTLPAGAALLFNPTFSIDATSLSCTPTGGTQQAAAFTYVQKINGTASQTTYLIADAQAYQLAQLKTKIPTNYTLSDSAICPNGPVVGTNATATSATLTCTATGTVGWNWTPTTLAQLATSVAGASTTTAQLQLNNTQGIVAGSVKIALVNGSQMPQDASTITFAVSP